MMSTSVGLPNLDSRALSAAEAFSRTRSYGLLIITSPNRVDFHGHIMPVSLSFNKGIPSFCRDDE